MRGRALQSPHVPDDMTGSFSTRREKEPSELAVSCRPWASPLAGHGAAPGGWRCPVPASAGGRRSDPGCTSGLAPARSWGESQTWEGLASGRWLTPNWVRFHVKREKKGKKERKRARAGEGVAVGRGRRNYCKSKKVLPSCLRSLRFPVSPAAPKWSFSESPAVLSSGAAQPRSPPAPPPPPRPPRHPRAPPAPRRPRWSGSAMTPRLLLRLSLWVLMGSSVPALLRGKCALPLDSCWGRRQRRSGAGGQWGGSCEGQAARDRRPPREAGDTVAKKVWRLETFREGASVFVDGPAGE